MPSATSAMILAISAPSSMVVAKGWLYSTILKSVCTAKFGPQRLLASTMMLRRKRVRFSKLCGPYSSSRLFHTRDRKVLPWWKVPWLISQASKPAFQARSAAEAHWSIWSSTSCLVMARQGRKSGPGSSSWVIAEAHFMSRMAGSRGSKPVGFHGPACWNWIDTGHPCLWTASVSRWKPGMNRSSSKWS